MSLVLALNQDPKFSILFGMIAGKSRINGINAHINNAMTAVCAGFLLSGLEDLGVSS